MAFGERCALSDIYLWGESWLLSQCFKNGSEIMIDECGTFSIYDAETEKTESVKSNPHVFRWRYSYTPSLVCVEGMESDAALFISGKRGEEVGHKLHQVD